MTVKELRIEHGLSTSAMAKIAGISEWWYEDWEKKNEAPHYFAAKTLAEAFGVDPFDLQPGAEWLQFSYYDTYGRVYTLESLYAYDHVGRDHRRVLNFFERRKEEFIAENPEEAKDVRIMTDFVYRELRAMHRAMVNEVYRIFFTNITGEQAVEIAELLGPVSGKFCFFGGQNEVVPRSYVKDFFDYPFLSEWSVWNEGKDLPPIYAKHFKDDDIKHCLFDDDKGEPEEDHDEEIETLIEKVFR